MRRQPILDTNHGARLTMRGSGERVRVGRGLTVIASTLLVLWVLGMSNSYVVAQGSVWSIPQQIPGIEEKIEPPYLMADRARTVHAFYALPVDNENVVAYNQWTLEAGWTRPVDILLSPLNQVLRIGGAYLDALGVIHLIFVGSNPPQTGVFYSRALASEAGRASAWSKPAQIAFDAGPLVDASLGGDDKGNLIVVYSGKRDGYGLYAITSNDGGDTWSEPATVFLTNSDTLWVYALRSTLDTEGRFHVVWTVDNERGNGDAIYYARLESDRTQWSKPFLLAAHKPGGYEVDWPSIISYGNELMVVYDDDTAPGSIVPARWMRRSRDGGDTWSEPTRPFSLIGENGQAALLADSGSRLHMLFSNRIQQPETHGMWHSLWMGNAWSQPEAVVSGPASPQFDPGHAQAVISQGNIVLDVWAMDTFLKVKALWYAYNKLNTAEWPVAPLPTPPAAKEKPSASTTPIAPNAGMESKAATPDPSLRANIGVPDTDPTFGVVAGLLPAVGLLVIVIIVRRFGWPSV